VTAVGGFSALQRAEIAEMYVLRAWNEDDPSFSALQRAEIAEIRRTRHPTNARLRFQCSSTSRNC